MIADGVFHHSDFCHVSRLARSSTASRNYVDKWNGKSCDLRRIDYLALILESHSAEIYAIPAAFSANSCKFHCFINRRSIFDNAGIVENDRSEEHTSELQSRQHLVC